MAKQAKQSNQLDKVHPNAAGLEIGAREIFGLYPPDRTEPKVKRFGCDGRNRHPSSYLA